MTTYARMPGGVAASEQRMSRWSRRSLWMLSAFFGMFVVTSLVGEYVMLPWLDLNEGDLMLMERGVAGWTAEIVLALALIAPAVAGLWFAVVGLRHSERRAAWVALVLNAVAVLWVVYMFLDAIHMTYYRDGGWLWF